MIEFRRTAVDVATVTVLSVCCSKNKDDIMSPPTAMIYLIDNIASKRWAFQPPTRIYEQYLRAVWPAATSCSFLRLAVRFTFCYGFLQLNFQFLPFRMFLQVNRKKKDDIIFHFLRRLRVIAAQEPLAPHILPVHFLGLHYIVIRDTIQQCFKSTTSRAISCFIQPSNCGT